MLHPVYYIILFFITFYSYREISNNGYKAKIKLPYILIVSILIFLAGIRLAQGADYWPYFKFYININKYVPWKKIFDNDINIEITYSIISKILGYFRMPFFALLFIYALYSISIKSYIYYKYSPYPMISLLYFFMPNYFFGDSGHIRQAAAIACCLFSYQYIEKRDLFKFLVWVFIGYYFHKTAVIFLPAYWIANAYISTFKCIVILITGVIIGPFKPFLIFGNLFSNMSSDFLSEVTGGFYSYQSLEGTGFSLNDVVKILFISIILLNDNYIIKNTYDKNYMMMRNLVITYYFLYYALRENMIFSIRLPAVYGDFWIILIAMIIRYAQKSNRQLIYIYTVIYIYLMSWRIWPNSVALGFDKMSNIFTTDINIKAFIPREFAYEK